MAVCLFVCAWVCCIFRLHFCLLKIDYCINTNTRTAAPTPNDKREFIRCHGRLQILLASMSGKFSVTLRVSVFSHAEFPARYNDCTASARVQKSRIESTSNYTTVPCRSMSGCWVAGQRPKCIFLGMEKVFELAAIYVWASQFGADIRCVQSAQMSRGQSQVIYAATDIWRLRYIV